MKRTDADMMDRDDYKAIRKEMEESSATEEMKLLYMLAGATETLSQGIFRRLRAIYAGHGYTIRDNDTLKGLNAYCKAVRQAAFLYCDRIDGHIIDATWGVAERSGRTDGVMMYDNFCTDANSIVRLMMLVVDRTARDGEASRKMWEFILGMPSKGIFKDEDMKRYRLK